MILGGETDSVDEADIGLGIAVEDELAQPPRMALGGRGLADDAQAVIGVCLHVFLSLDDVVAVQVFGQPANLNMPALADDDDMAPSSRSLIAAS